jgi:RimJ/RimL family protein N-acetyltransferase
MDVSIRQLTENDWREFSQIRLKALQSDPNVFGSNYEMESQMTEAEWRMRFHPIDAAIFLVFENDTPIGTACVAVDRDDPTKKVALFWGSWLAPQFRGKGLSELLYKARIKWAKQHPTVEKLIVSHRASNLSSKFANQKHGFVLTHKTEKTWIDGATEDEIFYELKIKP